MSDDDDDDDDDGDGDGDGDGEEEEKEADPPFFFLGLLNVDYSVSFQKSILGLWYVFNLTTSHDIWNARLSKFTFDFDWVKHT